jgi:transposase
MVADTLDFVIGVDTHRDRHALAVVDALGGRRHEEVVEACAAGYERALELAEAHAPGRRLWAIEGAGSYGAGLARHLGERGEQVTEIERPKRPRRRGGAKSDAIDALRAARETLAAERPAVLRQGVGREALRVLIATRAGAVRAKSAAINELKGLLVSAPESLRGRLRTLTRGALVAACAELRPRPGQAADLRAHLLCLRCLARRIRTLEAEAASLEAEITAIVRAWVPELLGMRGVGPIVAAQLVVSYSHPGRFRSEAAFASLAGVAPIPASSGQTVRHRLNRGGDRQLNRALRVVVLCRLSRCERTRAYIARRVAEGKTRREARRCAMRYLARGLYRTLNRLLAERPEPTVASGRMGRPTITPPPAAPGLQRADAILARVLAELPVEGVAEEVPQGT